MAIKIHQNDYIAPAIETPTKAANRFEGLSTAIMSIGRAGESLVKIAAESEAENTRQTVNQEISKYNVDKTTELKKLKASGEPNIPSKMEKWSTDRKKEILERNKDVNGFEKLWNNNVYRVDNQLSLDIYEAKLEVDTVNDTNNRNMTLENNLMSTRLNPDMFDDNTTASFKAVEESKFMPYEAKEKSYNDIALQQQTTAYLSTVDNKGVEEANRALLDGEFNFVYKFESKVNDQDDGWRSYNLLQKTDRKGNPVAAALVKSAENYNFSAILESGDLALLQATKEQFDNSDRFGTGDTYSLGKVGIIWDKQEKEHKYNQLNKAIKNKELKDQDTAQGQRVDLYIAAQNGDYVAAQSIRKMAESGDKFAKKSYKALQNSVPELCETAQEAFNGFAEKIRTLASIDVNKPASMGEMSGQTRYKTALWDALQYLEDHNHITKDLSPEDKKLWGDMVVTLNENIGQNITSLVDGLMTAKEAMNAYNIFRHTKANADVDVGALLTSVPTVSVEGSGKTYSQKGFDEDRYNKKQDDFISNNYVRSVFTIESNYAGVTDPVLLQRKQALLAEAKNTFLTEKRLQVAPELYWADSTSNYKIHEVGHIITINNRNYVLKGYESLIFPILTPETNNGRR